MCQIMIDNGREIKADSIRGSWSLRRPVCCRFAGVDDIFILGGIAREKPYVFFIDMDW